MRHRNVERLELLERFERCSFLIRWPDISEIDARHGVELEAGEAGIEQGAFGCPEERQDRQIGFNQNLLRLVVKFHPFFTIQLPGSELD
jgi:hypothetical protein